MNRSILIFLTIVQMGLASVASAQDRVPVHEMPVKDTFDFDFSRTHDRGLYLRLGLGTGFAGLARGTGPVLEESPDTLRMATSLHLGGLVTPGVALHLSQLGLLGARQGSLGLGLGATLMPDVHAQHFVSASLGAATAYDLEREVAPLAQWGFMGEVELGTGWWLTQDSGLLISAYAGGGHVDLEADGVLYMDWRVGARLSWTLD